MESFEKENRYNEILHTFLAQREKIRTINHAEAMEREAEFLNYLHHAFTREDLDRCRLYKELVGSTEPIDAVPNIDLPGNVIQTFMNNLVSEFE